MIEGFCIPCGSDVPVDASRCCLRDGHIAIPPTYGKRGQKWEGGTWVPPIERPEGWVWTPPAAPEPKTHVPKAAPVAPPMKAASITPQQRRARKAAKAREVRAAAPVLVSFVCDACHVSVTKRHMGGPTQRFCSSRCRNKGRGPRPAGKRTMPMSAEGRRCLDCGRDDVPHRAHGRCPGCVQRARRRAQKAAAV